MNENSFAKAGTAGGTITVILMNITSEDLAKTALLAAVGAIVSFGISYVLKLLVKKLKR